MAIKLVVEAIPQHAFNALEIHPCREYEKGTPTAFVEQCEPSEAEFWSVYVRYNPKTNKEEFGGLECIADCDTEEEAKQLEKFLTAFAEKSE